MIKIGIVVAIFTFSLFASLTLFTLFGFDDVLREFIKSNVVMSPDTYDLWGANPGSSNTITVRNYTFYNFTNPRGYMYRGEMPRFTYIAGYLYQYRSNFTNYHYSDDQSQISFDYWLFFTDLEGTRPLNEKINLLNVVPHGFWSQLYHSDWPTFAIQGFGGLFVYMNNTIKSQALGQGIAGQYLQSYSSLSSLCSNFYIDNVTCWLLWTDLNYGLNDPNNYEIWVDFTEESKKGFDCQMLLYEYFGFTRQELGQLREVFKQWRETVNTILNNWYCGGGYCVDYELTLLQLSSGGLTNNPPTGTPVESICMGSNVTCVGSPELSTFLHHYFKLISNDSKYQSLNFTIETTRNLFRPNTGTFLNIGNLTTLFNVGKMFDESTNPYTAKKHLYELRQMTHAYSTDHAFVIWYYAKYFTRYFVLKLSSGGSRKIAGMGGIFSQALYQSVTDFGYWALINLLSLQVAEQIPNCYKFLLARNLSEEKVERICVNVSQDNYTSYWNIIEPCNNEHAREPYKYKMGLSIVEMEEFCDIEGDSVYAILETAHLRLKQQYNCTVGRRCTKNYLAIKQFVSSAITLNPLVSNIRQFPSELTGHNWDPSLQYFYYLNFLNYQYGNTRVDPQQHDNYTQLTDLLSFDKFFSAPMMMTFLSLNDTKAFKDMFYWENMTLLKNYVRFVVVEVGFGGYTTTHTVNEFVFGYDDPFLTALKEMEPMLGGDPSVVTTVAFNEPNVTLYDAKLYPQTMYSGYSDPRLTRDYVSIFNEPYIMFNMTHFDGYNISWSLMHPFKEKVPISGTDAFQNAPALSRTDNVSVFISNLYRVGDLNFNYPISKFDFDLYRYKMSHTVLESAKEYPPNDIFYQELHGFINMSFTGVPLFISKNHFLDADPAWENMVDIRSENGYKQLSNPWDDTYLIVEPNTGASFTAVVYLQTNVLTSQDILFVREPIMIPVFSLYRSGNITESSAKDLFGDLQFALAAKRKLLLIGLFGLALTAMLTLVYLHKIRVKMDTTKKESLLYSVRTIYEGK